MATRCPNEQHQPIEVEPLQRRCLPMTREQQVLSMKLSFAKSASTRRHLQVPLYTRENKGVDGSRTGPEARGVKRLARKVRILVFCYRRVFVERHRFAGPRWPCLSVHGNKTEMAIGGGRTHAHAVNMLNSHCGVLTCFERDVCLALVYASVAELPTRERERRISSLLIVVLVRAPRSSPQERITTC